MKSIPDVKIKRQGDKGFYEKTQSSEKYIDHSGDIYRQCDFFQYKTK
jgi:hypothetical protein